jgi:hypothetical protein
MPPTGRFQKNSHTPVWLAGLAVAAMFGDAARRAAGPRTFVPARALIAIPAFPCMEPMALMAAQGIGRLIRPAVGEIGGSAKRTGMHSGRGIDRPTAGSKTIGWHNPCRPASCGGLEPEARWTVPNQQHALLSEPR